MYVRLLAFLILVIGLAVGAAAGERPIAVLTGLDVVVRLDGKPARLLQTVPLNARVEAVGLGSHATVSYVRGGARVYINGPCVFTAVAEPANPPSGSSYTIARPRHGMASSLPDQVNIDRMGGARPADPLLLHIGKTMDAGDAFEWRSKALYAEYVVHLEGPGLQPAFEETVTPAVAFTRADTEETPWNVYRYHLPSDIVARLQTGKEYELRLGASETRGARGPAWRARFKVGDPAEMARMRVQAQNLSILNGATSSDVASILELVSAYLGNDMLFAAWHTAELANPANPHVRELLRSFEEAAAGLQASQNSRGLDRGR